MFDKSFMLFLAVGIGFFYVVTTYVGDIQREDDKFQNSAYQQEHQYDEYYTVDSVGDPIIDATYADNKIAMDIWDKSALKNEFLELFPDFDTMRAFIKNRVRGEYLVSTLLGKINKIEDQFFSGKMSAEDAKRALAHMK